MKPNVKRITILLILGAAAAAAAYLVVRPDEPPPVRAGIAVSDLLGGGDTAGYARALEPRRFTFPDDHGPHPEYRSEWWYFTGNLEAVGPAPQPTGGPERTAESGRPRGRRFGFQLTFFRSALAPGAARRASSWATHQAYMAHFAVTDVAADRFHHFGRLSRAAVGLAGASARPFRVWLGDWSAGPGADDAVRRAAGAGGRADGTDPFPMRLSAAEDGVAVDLLLEPGRPLVLRGDRGLSRKGPEPGNASYYYSYTRLPARGTVRVDGREYAVEGTAWLDREWGTSALGTAYEGWDWFALRLSDGRDLVVYRLRRRDGGPARFGSATVVEPDGTASTRSARDVRIDVLDHWPSPVDGTRYPSRWRVAVPGEELRLEVEPLVADQEMDLAVRYWEGAVRVRGTSRGAPVRGTGYVELTGYASGSREPGGPE